MIEPPPPVRIIERAARAGIEVSRDTAEALNAYLVLLARWNRKINLTALPIDPPTDAAIDRLIVEALAAVRLVRPGDQRAVDIGSGGGSPALPLKIAVPRLRMVLVEARARKSAFLREAIRHLHLDQVSVETNRAESLADSPAMAGLVDIVMLRAVKGTPELWSAMARLLTPGGRVFWFADADGELAPDPRFKIVTRNVAERSVTPVVLEAI